MAEIAKAELRAPHGGRRFANSTITIEAALPACRIALRAEPKAASKLTKSLGLKLPVKPAGVTTKNGRSALWLGPDEWLIIDNDPAAATGLVEDITAQKCSAVDVSHRNTAILVSGPAVEGVLNAGSPRDLSLKTFPAGTCSRTIFGKIEIILWRLDETTFRVEVWRSFSEYLWDYLLDAAKDTGI